MNSCVARHTNPYNLKSRLSTSEQVTSVSVFPPGMDSGDTVDILNNSLDCEDATTLGHINTLVKRGVNLESVHG